MKKEFIPYKEAIALKKLGFNEKCLGRYDPLDNELVIVRNRINLNINSRSIWEEGCTAPLYQQAFEWFRNKHFTVGYVIPFNGKWSYNVISNKIELQESNFKTYREAETACLKKLIKINK